MVLNQFQSKTVNHRQSHLSLYATSVAVNEHAYLNWNIITTDMRINFRYTIHISIVQYTWVTLIILYSIIFFLPSDSPVILLILINAKLVIS